jgi:polyphenol oxidase
MPESPFTKGSDQIYRCPTWRQFTWLEHGFGTRHSLGAGHGVITLRQIHSAQVQNARGLEDRQCEGDALVSNGVGQRIGVRTADCVPVLLVDVETRSVSAIHAGWRGTVASIVSRAVESMRQNFGSRPEAIHAAIGPCIRVCCYEVGPEVLQQFQLLFPDRTPALVEPNRIHLNLAEANRRLLYAAGVPLSQIYDSLLCTCCAPEEFHSYRREPADKGRLISFIGRTQ